MKMMPWPTFCPYGKTCIDLNRWRGKKKLLRLTKILLGINIVVLQLVISVSTSPCRWLEASSHYCMKGELSK